MAHRLAGLVVVVGLITAAACSDESPVPGSAAPTATALSVPRFEPAGEALQGLVGTTFVGDLPALLHAAAGTARSAGAAILNAGADPAERERVGMHWVVTGQRGDFLVTDWAGHSEDGIPSWTVRSAWQLVLEAEMVVTFGTNVCAAPPGSYDGRNGAFVAVTDQAQDRALGAWTMTAQGPRAYRGLEGLDCERFTP